MAGRNPLPHLQKKELNRSSSEQPIRSIWFSDELAMLIHQQAGQTFTEKLENLVTRCVWDQPLAKKVGVFLPCFVRNLGCNKAKSAL